MFIKSLQLGGSGQIPNLTFEVAVSTSTSSAKTKLQTEFADGTSNDISAYNIGPGVATGSGVITLGAYTIRCDDTQYESITYTNAALAKNLGLPLTIEFFITFRFVSTGAAAMFLFSTNVASFGAQQFQVAIVSSQPRIGYLDWVGAGGAVYVPLVFDQKNHVAMVYTDANTFSLYVNGVRYINARDMGSGIASPYVSLFSQAQNSDYAMDFVYGGVRVQEEEVYTGASFTPPTSFPPPDFGGITQYDSTVQDVTQSLCSQAGLSAGQFDVTPMSTITQPVRSMAVSQVSSARTVLEMLAQCYHFDAVARGLK